MGTYNIDIVYGVGTGTTGMPNGPYDIGLTGAAGATLAYEPALYTGTDAATPITTATLTGADEIFEYYVGATGSATIRVGTEDEQKVFSMVTLTGVNFRRTVGDGQDKKYLGSLLTSAEGAAVANYLPFVASGTSGAGPDITYEIDTHSLNALGYTLTNASQTSITHKIISGNATETYFDFIVRSFEKIFKIYDKNAGIYSGITNTTAPTEYYGIETGVFTMTGPKS